MSTRKLRSARGEMWHNAMVVISLGGLACYAYQYFAIYKAPNTLVNKDFVCGDGSFQRGRSLQSYQVLASQDPSLLRSWVRASSWQARLAAPDKALANENERDRIMFSQGLVNLANSSAFPTYSERYNPLVVHVVDTDYSDKEAPLLLVRPINKCHKGETWYISALSINPAANVTSFAEVAAKTHRIGLMDVVENKEVRKAFDAVKKLNH